MTMGITPYLCVLLLCLTGVRSQIVLTQPESVVKKPGESVRLTCTVSGFSLDDYWMHWVRQVPGKGLQWLLNYKQGRTSSYAPGIQGRFVPSRGSTTVAYLDISQLRVDDTAMYYCARDTLRANRAQWYYLDYWGSGTFLEVTSDVQIKPSVYASSTYRETSSNQDEISLLCLVKDFQPKSIDQTWSSDNRVITTGVINYPAVLGQNMTYTMSSVIKVSASEWDANKVYHCKAGYKSDEMVTAEIKKPTPQAPHVFSVVPSPEVVYNQTTAALGCMLSGFYPDSVQVSWFKAGVRQSGTKLPSKKGKGNMFETISYLTVQVADWKKGDEYTCEVIHEATSFNTRINMKYQEEMSLFLQNPSMEELWINKTATLVCTAVCSDPSQVRITWNVNGKQRSEGVTAQPQREEGTQYIIISQLRTTAEEWENGMEVVCSAQNDPSSSPVTKRSRSVRVPPKHPEIRLLPPLAQEIKNQSRVTLECVITGFYPDSIQVSWEKDGSLTSSNTRAGPTALEQTETFSVRHYLNVRTEEWRKGSVFTCAVSHPPSNFNIRKEVKNVQEISVFIRNPSKEEVWINRTATVLCTAVCSDPSQIRITWNVNGKQRSEGVTTQQQKEEGTKYMVISQLRTTAEEWENGMEVVCSAQSGSSSSPVSKRTRSIKAPPKSPQVRLLPPSAQEIKNQSRVTLECVITGFYPDSIQVSWE
ncbi:immunoglobulin gamma-1 heavy chain-like, partial [Chiloscyllium plagiosum]|uniref:immunoglobulin gamma-1 heavy chain-like n=1 Tax=Chiloscyllium plagiosum TaxID=36176 RepID=UPI001CB83FA3